MTDNYQCIAPRCRLKAYSDYFLLNSHNYFQLISFRIFFFFLPLCNSPKWATASSLYRIHDHNHPTLGRNPLDEWSAPRGDQYLTTHNPHKRQTSMPPAGFEPTVSASEWPQTHVLPGSAFWPQTNMERTHHNEKETTRPQNQRDKMANWEKFPTIAREQTTNL